MLHSPSNQRDVKLQLEEKHLAAFILGRLVRLSALPICVEFSSLLNSAICLMAPHYVGVIAGLVVAFVL